MLAPLLLIDILAAACGGAANPAQTPVPTVAQTAAPNSSQHLTPASTQTAAPTPSPTAVPIVSPTPTPVRALDPAGPWLVGMTDQGPVAINPDGTGWTEFFARAANANSAGWLEAELSSTGWMAAIVAGSEGFPTSLVIGRPGMGIVRKLPILTPELEAEMDQPDENGLPKAWTQDVYLALDAEGWLDTLAWSPDGRTLAYVAAVDGPSADVYVYDTVADEVRRLTDGPNQPKLLGWSADSRWVLHLEITDINLGDGIWWDTLGLWAAAVDGSQAKKVPGVERPLLLLHWGSPTRFMVIYYGHGPLPPAQIDLIDVDTGPVATLYPGFVYQWAIDPETGTLAFLVDPSDDPAEPGLEAGLYLVSPERPTPQLVGYADSAKQPHLDYTDAPVWSAELNAFLIPTSDDRVTFVSTAGEMFRRIEGECGLPVPSPDGRWLAFRSCSRISSGIRVLSEQDGRVLELSLGTVGEFFWGPDSAGIYYFQGSDPAQLIYVPIPEGLPRLIHPDSGLEEWYWPPRFVEGP